MRPKEKKCIITFRTTTAAMAMERCCRERSLPGRLIPVPRSISAGCGMCWAAPAEMQTILEDLVMEQQLVVDGIYLLML